MYMAAAEAFANYIEGDYEHNKSLGVPFGICNYFEKIHGFDIIKSKVHVPELEMFSGYDSNAYDGHMFECSKNGAEQRVIILLIANELYCSPEMLEEDSLDLMILANTK